MIGKTYILSKNSESTYWLGAFNDGLIGDSTEVTVNKIIFEHGVFGASEVSIDGKVYNKPNDYFWCFFTQCMVKDSRYNLTEKVVHESAGVVGVSRCETEYLNQGKNGLRLQESVDRIRKSVGIAVKKPLETRYNEWVLDNIHIYDLFCKFTLEAISAGHEKISHWLIVNRLRWEVEVVTKGMCEDDKEYKISNDYIAFLARDFIKDHPEHKDIFNLKQMKRV